MPDRLKDHKEPSPSWRWRTKHAGVDMSGVNPALISYLNTLEPEYQEMILATAGKDGEHSARSRHYSGNAIDLAIEDKEHPMADRLFDRLRKDPERLRRGLTLLDPSHGTAPHIHLSYGDGTENHKDVWMDPHGEEARALLEGDGEGDKDVPVGSKGPDVGPRTTPFLEEARHRYRFTPEERAFVRELSGIDLPDRMGASPGTRPEAEGPAFDALRRKAAERAFLAELVGEVGPEYRDSPYQ